MKAIRTRPAQNGRFSVEENQDVVGYLLGKYGISLSEGLKTDRKKQKVDAGGQANKSSGQAKNPDSGLV